MNKKDKKELMNKFKVPKQLEALSKIFNDNGFELYIVGGYIRDYILGIETTDIDICSNATPSDLEKFLPTKNFAIKSLNTKTGTYQIIANSPNSPMIFEYASFRQENYDSGHTPNKVTFVNDIKIDASRRDFTINSIYYNIRNREIIDIYNGIEDCLNKVLRVIHNEVFDCDGLRILRMLRFAYTRDLIIDDATYNKAKARNYLLKDIAHTRIAQELRWIIYYNQNVQKQNINFTAYQVLLSLFDLRILEYIFFGLSKYIELPLLYEYAKVDENLFNLAENEIVVALMYCLTKNIEYIVGLDVPSEFYIEFLGTKGFMFVRVLIGKYKFIINGLITLDKMVDHSLFINYVQVFYMLLDDIIKYRKLLYGGQNDEKLNRVITTYKLMKVNNIPCSYQDLAIKPNDIIERYPNLPKNQIKETIDLAFIIATNYRNNDKDFLLKQLDEILSKWGLKNDK